MNRQKHTRLILRAAAACAFMLCVTAIGLQAQSTNTIQRGNTYVNLSSTFVNALGSLGVTPGTVFPTRLDGTYVNFPVTGGAIDLSSGKSQVLHSGGLTLTAGNTVVVLQSFIIDTTNLSAPVITGLVSANGTLVGRIPLFDLTLPTGITLPLSATNGFININGVGVTLDPTAASALDGVFNVQAFKGGFPIGTAYVELFLQHAFGHMPDHGNPFGR